MVSLERAVLLQYWQGSESEKLLRASNSGFFSIFRIALLNRRASSLGRQYVNASLGARSYPPEVGGSRYFRWAPHNHSFVIFSALRGPENIQKGFYHRFSFGFFQKIDSGARSAQARRCPARA
jgi:hypothetical protein